MLKLHRIHVVLIALVLIVVAYPAQADPSWTKVKERGEVVIGLCAQYPPFESKNEKTGQLAEAEIVMVLPKGTDELTGRLNSALKDLRTDGTYQKIHDRWLKVN